MPRTAKPFHLFIYGTLMNPNVFRAVLGKEMVHHGDAAGGDRLLAREAVLEGYKKISPDSTYMYAIPDRQGRIRGFVVGPLYPPDMAALRLYEGRNYTRKTLAVQTKEGRLNAVAFIGNLKRMEHSFGYPFHDPFKQEILLQEKIDSVLLEAQREQLHNEDALSRRAMAQLYGDTIRDLIRQHFDAGGISDYAIRSAIKGSPLRDTTRIAQDPKALQLAANYLRLVIRQVLFNEIEEKIRRDFRYELDHMKPGDTYYDRTISMVATLRIINGESALADTLCDDCLRELGSGDLSHRRLLDTVRWAVSAADACYDSAAAKNELAFLKAHRVGGAIPIGAELEFSNIGHSVIPDAKGPPRRDEQYDGFLYFRDFALDVLTWKMGGHIDDHHVKLSTRPRRGFFETALGSLSLDPNLSKPLTNDPWLIHEIVQQVRNFFPIVPHSLHLSMQLRTQHRPNPQRLLPLYAMKCLFALGGDPGPDAGGRLVIRRLQGGEIVRLEPTANLLFSDISRRHSSDRGDDFTSRLAASQGRYVQQFKFLRLSPKINYESMIIALKGLQISFRPGSFLTPQQYHESSKHRTLFHALVDWGNAPTPISEPEMLGFLGRVYDGLLSEHRGKPAHSNDYIAASLTTLRGALESFNEQVRRPIAKSAEP